MGVVLDVDGRRSSAVALSIVVDRQLEGFFVLTGIASSGEKFVSR